MGNMRGASMILVLVGLLAMIQFSSQRELGNPIRMPIEDSMIKTESMGSDDKMKETSPIGALGLVVTTLGAEKALNDTGLFTPFAYFQRFGRTFISGKIRGADVVYVRTAGTPSIHVAITIQILVNYFNVRGIVNYGAAGTTNETINIGDVVVPDSYVFTGAFEWLGKDSSEQGQLVFGDYNTPEKGDSLLGSLSYEKVDVYSGSGKSKRDYIPVSPGYTLFATLIEPMDSIKVILGLNASSSDIYVKNAAYREFLYKNFRVSTVDTQGAAIAMGALSNNLPYIVFQGVANKAGAGSGESDSALAYANAVKAATRFIFLRRCY